MMKLKLMKKNTLKFCCMLIMLLCSTTFSVSAQTNASTPETTVSGIVFNESGEELIGARVMVKGTDQGTITDFDGKFIIKAPQNSTIVISYLGSQDAEIIANGQQNQKIILKNDAEVLDELVVVAYGVQRKKDLTGSVSVVDTKEMQKMISPNLGESLQGLASGVSVATSGAPGSSPDIRIRGIGSLSNVGPLYVVDGLILDGAQRELNMNDVESVQVLKDAAATSLYGARGANGVIIVTTKRGKDGPTRINMSMNFGVQSIAKKFDMMNSVDFLRVSRLAYENADKVWIGEPQQGQVLVNTDWQDEFMKTGFTQDYNFDVSGGNNHGNYLFSLGYYNQDGVVKGPTYERYTVRSNAEGKKGIFTFGENFMFGRSSTQPLIGSPFIDLARMAPVIPVYDENNKSGYGYGSAAYPTYGSNPIALQETNRTRQTSNRFLGNFFVQAEPIKGLVLKSNMGVEYHNWFDKEKTIYKQIRYLDESKYTNRLLERSGNFTTWIWENTATYNLKIDKHRADFLAGYTAEERKWRNHVAGGFDLSDGFWVLTQAQVDPWVEGSAYNRDMVSFLGRINYDYNDKYLLQFNFRRDGSSYFLDKRRYESFLSGSLGWRISEEAFFENLKSTFDDLKFRVSYGEVGDQQAVGANAYSSDIVVGEGAIRGEDEAYRPGKIQKEKANPNIKWERKQTFNIGLDFVLLNQKVYGSVEYYNAKSKDLLVQEVMAWVDGTDMPTWRNVGEMTNRGFDINIGYRETKSDFKYNISANVSTLRNRVNKMDQDMREAGLSNINRTKVGSTIGAFYLVQTDGIFQTWDEVYAHQSTVTDENGVTKQVVIQPNAAPGDIRYKDINGDGIINDGDRVYAGKPLPSMEFGLTLSGEYKGFDMSLFFAGVTGNSIFNNTKYWLERMDEVGNYPKNLNPWTPENPSTTTPRPFMGPNDNTLVYSDRWIEKGDYIRLKNVQLGYTFPKSMLKKAGFLEQARIYFGVQNLFTITGYSGLDPEISGGNVFSKGTDDGHFPPVRTFSAGFQLSF